VLEAPLALGVVRLEWTVPAYWSSRSFLFTTRQPFGCRSMAMSVFLLNRLMILPSCDRAHANALCLL